MVSGLKLKSDSKFCAYKPDSPLSQMKPWVTMGNQLHLSNQETSAEADDNVRWTLMRTRAWACWEP